MTENFLIVFYYMGNVNAEGLSNGRVLFCREGRQMSRILVIEDDQLLNGGLCFNLQNGGYETIPVYDLKSAYPVVESQKFDLMLLDVNLPDGNGFDFAREIQGFNRKPLIFITAHELDEEVMEGFSLGADDYITKPFNVQIAMQRIQAVLRRTMGNKEEHIYRCGNLVIDFETRTVTKSGEKLALTPTEFKLLYVFVKNENMALTRNLLLEKLWDSEGNFVDEHTLTINISRLRAKIKDAQYKYIKTLYGMGYQWIGVQNE